MVKVTSAGEVVSAYSSPYFGESARCVLPNFGFRAFRYRSAEIERPRAAAGPG